MLLRTHKKRIVFLISVLVLHPHFTLCATTTRTLKLGVRKDCPPFSYASKEGYRGYSVDLCTKIAEELKAKGYIADYQPVEISAQNRFEKLQAEKVDLLCEATTVTIKRLHKFRPTLYTFISGASFMHSLAATNLRQADTFHIGALKGTTTIAYLKDLKNKNQKFFPRKINLENANLVDTKTHYESIELFRRNEIQYYFADREILISLSESIPDGAPILIVAPDYLTVEPYALFTRSDDLDINYIANQTLSNLYSSGEIENIFRNNFKGKMMSETLVQLFRMQILLIGKDPLAEKTPGFLD